MQVESTISRLTGLYLADDVKPVSTAADPLQVPSSEISTPHTGLAEYQALLSELQTIRVSLVTCCSANSALLVEWTDWVW